MRHTCTGRCSASSTTVGHSNSIPDTTTKRRKSDSELVNLHHVHPGSTSIADKGNKPNKSMTTEQFSLYLEESKQRAMQRKYEREEKALYREHEKKEKLLMLEKQKYHNILNAPLPHGSERTTKASLDRDKKVG